MTNAQEVQAFNFSPFVAVDSLIEKIKIHNSDKEYIKNLTNWNNAMEYVLQNVKFPEGIHVSSMAAYIASYVRRYAQENN